VQLGMAESTVRQLVGDPEPLARWAVQGREPPLPIGSHCWYIEGDSSDRGRIVTVDRYCFAGARLVEKRHVRFVAWRR